MGANVEKSSLKMNGKTATLLQYDKKIKIVFIVDKVIIKVSSNLEKVEIMKNLEKLF